MLEFALANRSDVNFTRFLIRELRHVGDGKRHGLVSEHQDLVVLVREKACAARIGNHPTRRPFADRKSVV